MSINLEGFFVLNEIVETGSFANAAEKLNKAQSAISYQIRKLESELGTKIFNRDHYRATLTPAGKVILQEARKLIHQTRHINLLADRYAEGWEPNLDIVIDGALPMDPVMKALKIITKQDIPTRITLKVEFLGGVQRRFIENECDLMLVKDYVASPGFVAEPLPGIKNLLVVSKDHELSNLKQVTRTELQQFVELSVNDSSVSSAVESRDAHQFGGDRVVYLSGFIYKKRAISMGLGYGWMPEFLIREELKMGELNVVDYQGGSEYQFTPRIVSTDLRPLRKAGLLFKKLVITEFSEK